MFGVDGSQAEEVFEDSEELPLQQIKLRSDSFRLEEPSSDFNLFAGNNSSFYEQVRIKDAQILKEKQSGERERDLLLKKYKSSYSILRHDSQKNHFLNHEFPEVKKSG